MGRFTDLLFARRDASPAPLRMVGMSPEGGIMPYGVTSSSALGLSAVWRSLDILANGVSQLCWEEKRLGMELPPSRIVRRPLGFITRREWTSYVVSVLALYDINYLLKVGGDDAEGVPMGLLPLDPSIVQPVTTGAYPISPFITSDTYRVGGMEVPRDQLVIIRRSPTPGSDDQTGGVIRLARAEFASAIAASNYASRYWQAGGSPTTVLESDAQIPESVATQISDRWRERRMKGPDYAPVLSGGIKAREMGADPTAQSAVEARREMVADIGRYFGVPTAILNAPAGDSETYATTEAQGLHLLIYTLSNYIGAIEDAITDLLPGGRCMCMDTSDLTKGSRLSQAQALQLATAGKPWMTVDEARDEWDLPPLENPSDLMTAPMEPVDA